MRRMLCIKIDKVNINLLKTNPYKIRWKITAEEHCSHLVVGHGIAAPLKAKSVIFQSGDDITDSEKICRGLKLDTSKINAALTFLAKQSFHCDVKMNNTWDRQKQISRIISGPFPLKSCMTSWHYRHLDLHTKQYTHTVHTYTEETCFGICQQTSTRILIGLSTCILITSE